ncbi:isoprenylcysteine carboxylmethyltransferase family protein [Cellulomonas sp. KRMCY2]|uniref:methyltransferase family protein n=1 Tax=Cellulomonas sp. KRMCY2 TaxID=1304865 RepID=UPI00045EAE73|nr:isoprenylcysteine carboxylmethyltransferase family protein [Cellulomonas sp. KRMCY2]
MAVLNRIDPADRIVAAQAFALAALAFPGRARWPLPTPVTAAATLATASGAALAVWGARPHGRRLTPRVATPTDLPLLRSGPYALSRNPIYAGLLLAGAGWALLRRRPEPLVAWAALAVVLSVKVRREEAHLVGRFGPSYEDYRRSTPRFLGLPSRRPRQRSGTEPSVRH